MAPISVISRFLVSGSDYNSLVANGSGWSKIYTCFLSNMSMKNFSSFLQRNYPTAMDCPILNSDNHGFLLCIRTVHFLNPLYLNGFFINNKSTGISIFCLPPGSLLTLRDVNDAVNDILDIAGVPDIERNSLVRLLLLVGRRYEETSYNTLIPLYFECSITTILRNKTEAADWLCGGTMDSVIVRTLRATKNSILKLKDGMLSSKTHESCMVCLEGFEDGERVSRLSCSHEFHYDCIAKWLGYNHHCPVCRFSMPWVDATAIFDEISSITGSYNKQPPPPMNNNTTLWKSLSKSRFVSWLLNWVLFHVC